jgi:hypothetical protein
MRTPSTKDLLDRAKMQFDTHGAEWGDRTAPAIINVVSPLIMDLEERTMPPGLVLLLREIHEAGFALDSVIEWLDHRYDMHGKIKD